MSLYRISDRWQGDIPVLENARQEQSLANATPHRGDLRLGGRPRPPLESLARQWGMRLMTAVQIQPDCVLNRKSNGQAVHIDSTERAGPACSKRNAFRSVSVRRQPPWCWIPVPWIPQTMVMALRVEGPPGFALILRNARPCHHSALTAVRAPPAGFKDDRKRS